MDIGNFLASISIVAILALVGTTLILLFELRHLFFHKKVAANPEIPDFDGNIHTAPEHATLIDVDSIEHGGVNKTLVMILLGIIAILIIVVIAGFMYGNKKPTTKKPAVQVPTAVPTQIIEIERISPTSPFEEIVEIPFDLSGTPTQITSTPKVSVTDSATSSGGLQSSNSSTTNSKGGVIIATATLSASQSAQTPTAVANPSLPASGNVSHLILLSIAPFLLVAIAILF